MPQDNKVHIIFFSPQSFPQQPLTPPGGGWLWSSGDVKMSSGTDKMSGSSE